MTIIRLDVLLYLCITLYCAVAVLCCMLQNVLLIHCGVVCYDDQRLVKSLACDRELADGPREEWSESVIENYIISAVHNCTISRIITFDDHGVSGHPNHIAIHRAVRRMCESEKLAAAGIQEVLLLQSTSLLRKYISFIDAAWTSLFHRSVSMHHGREFCPLALWYSVRHPLG
ncbi:N-acetylglucosaminyl-phosphatidylinositol de-N-acetylase [Geodia barretti]|uniref:N-acetylglucosaminylphosphatidylinositol deacetylase n=1 Tax=Geodia barretti TaxID=519541 RepID=A0AA35WWI6_GEOBA|nr:N-acetylglucosaminyl-phosphatidylinositol de-N-acetylase [Geodia barretti]